MIEGDCHDSHSWLCALRVTAVAGHGVGASTAEGSIRGTIRDEQGAVLPGVTITATSPQAPRPTVTVSDGEGIYRLQNLLPGTYTLAAELQGFARHERTGVVMTAGLNLTVDVALSIGTLGETINVVADVPMLDTESSSKTVNISGELQRSLPLTSRKDFSDFLEVTPGVTARGFDQASGGQVYMVRGTDIESHVTLVDGADMGSFRQNWAGLYMGLSTDALEDVQVKTGGADASSPIGMGAITQVATKSGTNQFRGNGGFVFTADSWNGSNAAAGESAATTEVFQPEGALGGPILRDRAWFFGSFRYTRRNVGISRDATQLAALEALQPGFEPFPNQSRSKYYFAKVASQVSRRHHISGFYQYDLNPDETNWAYSAEKLNVSAFGGTGASTRLTSVWTDHFTTRVMVSYNDKSLNGTLDAYEKYPGTGPAINVYSSTAVSGGNPTGQGQIGELDNLFQRAAQPASKLTIERRCDVLRLAAGRRARVPDRRLPAGVRVFVEYQLLQRRRRPGRRCAAQPDQSGRRLRHIPPPRLRPRFGRGRRRQCARLRLLCPGCLEADRPPHRQCRPPARPGDHQRQSFRRRDDG